jgi:hypothetical protein
LTFVSLCYVQRPRAAAAGPGTRLAVPKPVNLPSIKKASSHPAALWAGRQASFVTSKHTSLWQLVLAAAPIAFGNTCVFMVVSIPCSCRLRRSTLATILTLSSSPPPALGAVGASQRTQLPPQRRLLPRTHGHRQLQQRHLVGLHSPSPQGLLGSPIGHRRRPAGAPSTLRSIPALQQQLGPRHRGSPGPRRGQALSTRRYVSTGFIHFSKPACTGKESSRWYSTWSSYAGLSAYAVHTGCSHMFVAARSWTQPACVLLCHCANVPLHVIGAAQEPCSCLRPLYPPLPHPGVLGLHVLL